MSIYERKGSDNKMRENLQKLYQYTTSDISDLLDSPRAMDYEIKPLTANKKIIGRAVTVDVPEGAGRCTAITKAIEAAKPGDILVLAGKGICGNALWGDKRSRKAMEKGVIGVVIDGVMRDIEENIALGFPVYGRGVVPCASRSVPEGAMDVPVVCGGVLVNPGDMIAADANGVIVFSLDELKEFSEK